MVLIISKLMFTWLAIDLLVIGTAWYAATTLQRFAPQWWKMYICDIDPTSDKQYGSFLSKT
ncbi:MAG: hypothetical protein AAF629_17005 [Chloroflexota bacterium]